MTRPAAFPAALPAALPAAFRTRPIAHRALHGAGRPENSLDAVRAAVAAGYGIEIDVQLTLDGRAVVFHDETLDRLTAETGPVRARTAAALGRTRLAGSDAMVPALPEVLDAVAGRVPLLIEVKDQDGALGPDVGPLEAAVAADLRGYDGPVAVMSFNPHSVAALRDLAPEVPRGLTTCAFAPQDWPGVPPDRLRALARIDTDAAGAVFISHDARDLAAPRVAEIRAAGLAVLCWTIRSPGAEAEARRIADNVTFEGYLPQQGGPAGACPDSPAPGRAP